jgi:hypothetical protein
MDIYEPEDKALFGNYFCWDASKWFFNFDISPYDFILLLDVIEHFTKPEAFLDSLRINAKIKQPKLIITTGNVAFFVIRLQLLLGHFNYGKQGILDLTHTKLYTFKTLRKLFTQCGFKIEKMTGIPAPFPKILGVNLFSKFLLKINSLLILVSKGLFSYQIFMTATPITTVDALLDEYISRSKVKEQEINNTRT